MEEFEPIRLHTDDQLSMEWTVTATASTASTMMALSTRRWRRKTARCDKCNRQISFGRKPDSRGQARNAIAEQVECVCGNEVKRKW